MVGITYRLRTLHRKYFF